MIKNSPSKKKTYKITNWREYSKALKTRGSLTFWFSEDFEKGWFATSDSHPQLQTKSLAFCLNEMTQPFPSELVYSLVSLNVDQFLQQWMKQLCALQDAYQMLPNQTKTLWEQYGVTLKLPLTSLYVEGLYRKFHLLQKLLTDELLLLPINLLIKLEPYIGQKYKQIFSSAILKGRFLEATKALYLSSDSLTGLRLSVSNSRRLMEIINLSNQELLAQMSVFGSGPLAALEQFVKLQKDNQDPNSLVQRILKEETSRRKNLGKTE